MMIFYYVLSKIRLALPAVFILFFFRCDAQLPDTSCNALEAFAPWASAINPGRDPDGKPGPGYWQNRADYKVNVSFDTTRHAFKGTVEMMYTNNSPHTLPYIWLDVTQNRYRKDSRDALLTPAGGTRFGISDFTDGCVIASLETGPTATALQKTAYQEMDTYIKVMLPAPLLPGKKLAVKIAYRFAMPASGSDLQGILATPKGAVINVMNLYPQVVAFSAIHGWQVLPGGYRVERGALDVHITVPDGVMVQGTGELKNPETVLPAAMAKRYRDAWKSDSVVRIRTVNDVAAARRLATGKPRTWHFVSDNAGAGMWGISAAFCWDAVRMKIPGGPVRTDHPGECEALAMTLYPENSNPGWQNITRDMKKITEMYSRLWTPYPYKTLVNIAGNITGVSAGNTTFISYQATELMDNFWITTNHELGHNWFGDMIKTDTKYGWMSEGLDMFINFINADSLGKERLFPIHDAVNGIIAGPNKLPPVNTPANIVPLSEFFWTVYGKAPVAMSLLRTKVLGPARFDPVFRRFIKDWAFKFPTETDFFRAIENGAGEELGWFWRSWFFNNWLLDQAVKQVAYVKDDPALGADITVENKRKMVMPVDVEIREFNGSIRQLHFPAQIWQQGATHSFHYASTSPVTTVIIDPKQELPDGNRDNNEWRPAVPQSPVPSGVTVKSVLEHYLQAVGGKEKIRQLQQADITYLNRDTGQGALKVIRKYSPAGEKSFVLGFVNIDFLLRELVAKDTQVTYKKFGAPYAYSGAPKEQLRVAASLFPELEWYGHDNNVVLRDSVIYKNGMQAYQLTVTSKQGPLWYYFYDVKTGYKIAEELATPTDEATLYKSIGYAGYQLRNGIVLPTVLIIGNKGENDIITELKDAVLTW